MIQAGYFWFVQANLRHYSAIVAMTGADAGEAGFPDRETWWAALANQSVRELRRAGWPGAIAGRCSDAFPSGTVQIDLITNIAKIQVDEAIMGMDYVAWVIREFGLADLGTTVVPMARRAPSLDPVGPPKPWY